MAIGKFVNTGYAWEYLELTKEETEEILGRTLKNNKDIFLNCIGKACEIAEEKHITREDSIIIEIARSLFEKTGISSFTEILSVLDKNASEIKKKKEKPIFKPDPKIEKKLDKILKNEEKKKEEESLVEKAFRKVEEENGSN
jgi:hypothetical protein